MIEVVTCHFNPCGYRRLVENYWAFRRHMRSFNVSLRTIELTFDDQKPQIDDAMHVHGTRQANLMWQKESLLNRLIETSSAELIAWIDADVWFMNPSWVEQATELLQAGADVIQLFSRAQMINKFGIVEDRAWKSSISAYLCNERFDDYTRVHPGLAWAARGDWLRRQWLYDRLVAGCGDSVMSNLWCGGRLDISEFSRESVADITAWRNCKPQPRLGYVSGTVLHMYHGSNANRNRREQRHFHQIILPEDVKRRDDGVLEWSETAPLLDIARIRDRFSERNEDD